MGERPTLRSGPAREARRLRFSLTARLVATPTGRLSRTHGISANGGIGPLLTSEETGLLQRVAASVHPPAEAYLSRGDDNWRSGRQACGEASSALTDPMVPARSTRYIER
ncbi:MAG: hypothetical protein QOF33_2615 [Thermomicrobiales bacterium]|nr:hypothetical protein [Thermomicrobiales bacterium]MEA2584530.1 hypothetical protein [Thermomicrobiales bacterium]